MIRDYANIAANERTFLAWVRTGIAIIALGFVIERFNLFLLAVAMQGPETPGLSAHRFAGPAGRWGGTALAIAGVLLIAVAVLRFLQTARYLADETPHQPLVTRGTLLTLSALVLAVAGFSGWLAIG